MREGRREGGKARRREGGNLREGGERERKAISILMTCLKCTDRKQSKFVIV